jgi:hypothetical protein
MPVLTREVSLARLKAAVEHLSDRWPTVLHRRIYMQVMGRREDLRDVFEQTYAAHVHNTLQEVLLIDLFRELGALVLDRNPNSPSIATVVTALRNPKILAEMDAEYRVVSPVPVRFFNENDLTPEMAADARRALHDEALRRNLEELASLPTVISEIEANLLTSDIGRAIWTARSKSVAHYDLVRDGSDWTTWRIEGTGLTYGQLDSYVDAATSAVDQLSHLVRRSAFDFEGSNEIGNDRITEYVDALVIGLRTRRNEKDARLAALNRELEDLQRGPADGREG